MFGSLLKNKTETMKSTALDALRASVMIADANLNVIYVNPPAMALMREAEPDLKKELPGFSAATLIGSNIDVFYKNPSHQRDMLATLQKPHSTAIRIGSRHFDLLVSPSYSGHGRDSVAGVA